MLQKTHCTAGQSQAPTSNATALGGGKVDRYKDILARADQVVYVQHEYTKDCYLKRDRYMVDHADLVIAVWNGIRSGTGYTVEYAQQQGIPVIVIDPDTARIRRILR